MISIERAYEVLRHPRVTEKSTLAAENNQIVFVVAQDAKKQEIKQAVERLFKVKVVRVNTVKNPGKIKRFRGRPGQQQDVKKAYITLSEGEAVDIGAGL
ncbi:MAG: 50S ribosomal protein L23 [Alphaproteobacteria bacterium]|nr:50S ribosomal protein L23 [Alphaproteobacteria bacterium]